MKDYIQKNYLVKRSLLTLALLMPVLTHAQCDIVAVVFETTICQTDIAFNNNSPGAKPLPPERQHEIEKSSLGQMIRSIAAQHLLTRESYTPSQEEVNSFNDFTEKAKASHGIQNRELIETIEHLLKTNLYTEIHRNQLEKALATFRRSESQSKRIEEDNKLIVENMRSRFGDDAVNEFHERSRKSRQEMSEKWVARWKLNKALYEKYAGRVIFQQAGIEPIDAYRALLGDIRGKGGLKILKPAYADVFSEFERYLDMGHNYLGDDGDDYFVRPYWETADLNDSHQRAIDEYKAIPHI